MELPEFVNLDTASPNFKAFCHALPGAFVLFLLYKYLLNTRLQFRVVIFLRYELLRKKILGFGSFQ